MRVCLDYKKYTEQNPSASGGHLHHAACIGGHHRSSNRICINAYKVQFACMVGQQLAKLDRDALSAECSTMSLFSMVRDYSDDLRLKAQLRSSYPSICGRYCTGFHSQKRILVVAIRICASFSALSSLVQAIVRSGPLSTVICWSYRPTPALR